MHEPPVRWVVTTQPQRTGSDGAGSRLHLPALVPPVPVCPLCTGTRARGACALARGAAPGALPEISQPFGQGELNCTFTTRAKERARVTTCTHMPLPTSLALPCSSPGRGRGGAVPPKAGPLPVQHPPPPPICPTRSQQQAESSALSQAIPFPVCPQAARCPGNTFLCYSEEGR